MNDFLKVCAPAKLNLFLHVVGQRADGYHLLQSIFQLIDLEDTVLLKTTNDGQITRLNPLNSVPSEDDLIVKAARLLQQTYDIKLGADLDLIKKIPMGAGLGGGSSDAASTLLGLNHLWQTGLNKAQLSALGLQLGADVPFFINGHTAFVEGIGEEIQTIKPEQHTFFIIYPGVGIPTVEIFKDPRLTRSHARITISDLVEYDFRNGLFNNDLEPVVIRKHPEVGVAKEWLLNNIHGSHPRMSGSGSTVFTEIPENLNANQLLSLAPKHWTCFVVRGLLQHPSYNLVPSQ